MKADPILKTWRLCVRSCERIGAPTALRRFFHGFSGAAARMCDAMESARSCPRRVAFQRPPARFRSPADRSD